MAVLDSGQPATVTYEKRGRRLLVTGNPVKDESGRIAWVVCNVGDMAALSWRPSQPSPCQQSAGAMLYAVDDGIVVASAAMRRVVEARCGWPGLMPV